MAQRPDEDTEPRVQQLFIGLYRETDIGAQVLANAGLCVLKNMNFFYKLISVITQFPFRKTRSLLTEDERKLYYALEEIAQRNHWHLFSKVRLEDLIKVPFTTENKWGFRNRIKSRHIDFVLCDWQSLEPLLAIELDGLSHLKLDQKEADQFKNQALREAGLHLLHIKTKPFYEQKEIEKEIVNILLQ